MPHRVQPTALPARSPLPARTLFPGQTLFPARIPLAIIANSQTPYRLHLHERIGREIPQVQLHSVFTHERSNADWAFASSDDIGAVQFGRGESCLDQSKPLNAMREWRRGGRIINWLKSHQIRFVVMMGYNDLGRIRIMRWCRQTGIACFLFGDSNIDGDRATGFKRLLKRWIVSSVVSWCDGVLCCGSRGRAYYLEYGANASSIFYFPYEPDYALIQDLDPAFIEEVRARFSLAADRRRFVFSGRLVAAKRPDLLIRAFNQLGAIRSDWDLVVIGSGPLEGKLKELVSPAMRHRVRWTGFMDDQRTVSAIYRCSDCLVLPSDYEPWALVVNEAAAAGLAIVSSSVVGAAAELVRDGVNGRLFPAGDESALLKSLEDVSDPTHIDRYKAESAGVLAQWRQQADPVAGLRLAFQSAGFAVL